MSYLLHHKSFSANDPKHINVLFQRERGISPDMPFFTSSQKPEKPLLKMTDDELQALIDEANAETATAEIRRNKLDQKQGVDTRGEATNATIKKGDADRERERQELEAAMFRHEILPNETDEIVTSARSDDELHDDLLVGRHRPSVILDGPSFLEIQNNHPENTGDDWDTRIAEARAALAGEQDEVIELTDDDIEFLEESADFDDIVIPAVDTPPPIPTFIPRERQREINEAAREKTQAQRAEELSALLSDIQTDVANDPNIQKEQTKVDAFRQKMGEDKMVKMAEAYAALKEKDPTATLEQMLPEKRIIAGRTFYAGQEIVYTDRKNQRAILKVHFPPGLKEGSLALQGMITNEKGKTHNLNFAVDEKAVVERVDADVETFRKNFQPIFSKNPFARIASGIKRVLRIPDVKRKDQSDEQHDQAA